MAKAALLGLGIVGTGVAEILDKNADKVSAGAGEDIELKYILEIRPCPDSPYADKIVKDFTVIENDPEIDAVCECIGGVGVAYDFVKRALLAGKSVITPNKQMIAEHGLELLAIAREKGVSLLFEASVGGGIPIIRPLTECLAANRIEEVYGILNGTTNYILTQMIQCNQDFDTALKDAQRLGYAEADPTADVEGIDACRKIAILADLCFGKNVAPGEIKTQGITRVTATDAALGQALGYNIKLLGRALRLGGGARAETPLDNSLGDDEKVAVYVAPHLLPKDKLLSNISGVMNGIVIRGNAVGECLFYGAGAGRYPTASAVVGDLLDAVRHKNGGKAISWDEGVPGMLADADELPRRWYVRAADGQDKLAQTFHGETAAADGCAAVVTEEMPLSQVKTLARGLTVENIFPVLD